MSYIDLATLKSVLEITDTDRDVFLQMCLDAATESVENACGGRVFTLADSATARTFSTLGRVFADDAGEHLIVDDIGSTSGLVVESGDGSTWTAVAAADYALEPLGSIAAAGRPATSVLLPGGAWTDSQARVTAYWGWPAVPARVKQATLTMALRLFKRPKSPEGVTASAEWGAVRIPRIDPDMDTLLDGLKLAGIA